MRFTGLISATKRQGKHTAYLNVAAVTNCLQLVRISRCGALTVVF